MRIYSITSANVRKYLSNNTKSLLQNNADNLSDTISDNVNFGVGEDYGGVDLDAPENPNTDKPGFKRGIMGIATILTFPVSVPAWLLYQKYKDKHEGKIKTNMNFDNIED